VLANEILDLSFCFVVERVIGGAHVREFCLSTVSRDGSPGQQRINGCDRRKELSECHSRPPSLNSQIRSSGAVTEPLRVGLEKSARHCRDVPLRAFEYGQAFRSAHRRTAW
jgi:hypothetical protein